MRKSMEHNVLHIYQPPEIIPTMFYHWWLAMEQQVAELAHGTLVTCYGMLRHATATEFARE